MPRQRGALLLCLLLTPPCCWYAVAYRRYSLMPFMLERVATLYAMIFASFCLRHAAMLLAPLYDADIEYTCCLKRMARLQR